MSKIEKEIQEKKEVVLKQKRATRSKKTIVVRSEYTEEELKRFYLLQCEAWSWNGLSRDVIDVVEDDSSDTIDYICPQCGAVTKIVR